MFDNVDEAIAFAKNTDDGGIPLFRYEAIEIRHSDPVEFEDIVMVRIILKGDTKTVIEREKREEDEKRWPGHWQAFCDGTDAPLEGTPLTEFPAMTPADVATCHRHHIRTVEDLAKMADIQLHNLGGRGVSLKKKAGDFLEYRQGPDVNELKAKIEKLEKLVGDNITNVPKRAAGNRVPKSGNGRRKQQSGRKADTTDSEDSGQEAG